MEKFNISGDFGALNMLEKHTENIAETNALLESARLIHTAMTKKGITKKELALLLEASDKYVDEILEGNASLTISEMAFILYKLGVIYKQSILSEEDKCEFCTVKNKFEKLYRVQKNITNEFSEIVNKYFWDLI